MPVFEVEFEVFCGTCGAGLCHRSDTRTSRNRHCPQVTVDVCQDCIRSETEPLNDEIARLQGELDEVRALLLAERGE